MSTVDSLNLFTSILRDREAGSNDIQDARSLANKLIWLTEMLALRLRICGRVKVTKPSELALAYVSNSSLPSGSISVG